MCVALQFPHLSPADGFAERSEGRTQSQTINKSPRLLTPATIACDDVPDSDFPPSTEDERDPTATGVMWRREAHTTRARIQQSRYRERTHSALGGISVEPPILRRAIRISLAHLRSTITTNATGHDDTALREGIEALEPTALIAREYGGETGIPISDYVDSLSDMQADWPDNVHGWEWP